MDYDFVSHNPYSIACAYGCVGRRNDLARIVPTEQFRGYGRAQRSDFRHVLLQEQRQIDRGRYETPYGYFRNSFGGYFDIVFRDGCYISRQPYVIKEKSVIDSGQCVVRYFFKDHDKETEETIR